MKKIFTDSLHFLRSFSNFLLAVYVLAHPISTSFADDDLKARFLREYPEASRKLASSLDGVKGACILTEVIQGRSGEGRVEGTFAVDHGYTKLTMNFPKKVGKENSLAELVLCGSDEGVFSLKKTWASPEYLVTSAGSQFDVSAELDERFGMLLRAPYYARDSNLLSLLNNPSVALLDVEAQATNGDRLVKVQVRTKSAPFKRGTVVLNPDLGWAIQHSDFSSESDSFEKYAFDVRYGPIVNGIPTLESVVYRSPDRTYGCKFTELLHEHTDITEFNLRHYNLPDLLASGRFYKTMAWWAAALFGIFLIVVISWRFRVKRRKKKVRQGFTLIEVLVVVSVIAILLSLSLPVVQSAREASRRASCVNNLKQIGLAVVTYEHTHGSFPLSSMLSGDPRYIPPGQPYCASSLLDKGFLVHILPQLEQNVLFNSVNHSLTIFGVENSSVAATSLASYTCPSDRSVGSRVQGSLDGYFPNINVTIDNQFFVATTSYAAIHGTYDGYAIPRISNKTCTIDPDLIRFTNGGIVELGNINYASIIDGASNTAIVTEKGTSRFVEFDRVEPLYSNQTGWWVAGSYFDTVATAQYPPNVYRYQNLVHISSFWPWHTSASSFHPGGVNILLADGSVRFVKESISSWPMSANLDRSRPGVWQALATRNGSDAVQPSEF